MIPVQKKPSLLKGSLCIIPYYGGINEPCIGHSSTKNRLDYLDKTIRSVLRYFERIVITVSEKGDFRNLIDRYENAKTLFINCQSPKYLPNYSLMLFQELLKNGYDHIKYIFYTEADQIVVFEDIQNDAELLDSSKSISPVRIEKIFRQGVSGRGLPIKYKGKDFVAYAVYGTNGLKIYNNLKKRFIEHGYYITQDSIEAYGAAWLCHRSLFLRAPFNILLKKSILESPSFDISRISKTLKAVRWQRCFVEHLSGYEFQQRIVNRATDEMIPNGFS